MQVASVMGIVILFSVAVNFTYAAEPQPFRIGYTGALTGSMATWGLAFKIVYQRVADMVNKGGGIKSMGGAKIELYFSDNESDAKKSVTEVEKMLTLRKPHVMFSPTATGLVKPCLPIIERYKVAMVGTEFSDELFKTTNPFYFGVMPKVSTNARTISDQFVKAANERGRPIKRAAVLSQDGSFGELASDTFGKYLPTLGVEVVANEIYPTGKVADFSDTIAKFKGLNAEVLFCSTPPYDAALIVRAMKAVDFNPQGYAFSCACIDSRDFINLGKDGDFAFGVPVFPSEDIGDKIKGSTAYLKDFYSGLDEKERRVCTENIALYDGLAAGTVMHALEQAKSYDPMVIREAIKKLDLKTGDRFIYWPDGIKFDQTGHNTRARAIGGQYQNMKLRVLFPESIVTPGTKPLWPIPKWTER